MSNRTVTEIIGDASRARTVVELIGVARRAALEEAAEICDECAQSHIGDLLPEARFVAKELAAAIRLRMMNGG
jgi:hypothetical protein